MKWKTLKHNGILFPKPYEYQKFNIIINNQKLILTHQAEEYLYYYVRKLNTPYVDDVFTNNFWDDFKKYIPEYLQNTKFPQDWDYSPIIKFIADKKLIKKSKEQLNEEKKIKLENKEKYGYAYIDGKKVEIMNYMVEPSDLFVGRGNHPKRGCIKIQPKPEDITINIGEGEKVPEGNWKKIEHAHNGLYVAQWTMNVTGGDKYILFSRSSHLIQDKEVEKFDKARNISKKYNLLEKYIIKNLTNKDEKIKKIATVCSLINKTSIRVGDEKGEDTTDTVGASTLRPEHIKIKDNNITFDFLGKDSIRFNKTFEFDNQTIVNIKKYLNDSKIGERLFPNIISSHIKEFLSECIKDTTAKNFRTSKASTLMSEYLMNNNEEHMDRLTNANYLVALTLNHQCAVPKGFDEQIQKLHEKLVKYKDTDEKKYQTIKKQIDTKMKLKGIALSTSKTNYIDPRIILSYCKEYELDINKVYTKQLQVKFEWAKDVDKNFWKEYK